MRNLLGIDFSEPYYFVTFSLVTFVIVFLRYLLASGMYHYVFFKLFRSSYEGRIIAQQLKKPRPYRLEIQRSAITSLIFSFVATIMILLWQQDMTAIYLDLGEYSLWYLPLSLLMAMLIHETYYYWVHRWMHLPKIYRLVHKWHHESVDTSVLTAFSFHPIESVLQALIILLLLVFLPMHIGVVLLYLIIMTISATINHGGVEIFPAFFSKHFIAKWLIGSTHHDLHHRQFTYNYGLYFTFWDKWMKTESPKSEAWFEQHTK